MADTAEAKTLTPAGRAATVPRGSQLAFAIQSGPPDDPIQRPAAPRPDLSALRAPYNDRHGNLHQQIVQCRNTGAHVLRAQSFAERARLLWDLHAGLTALAEAETAQCRAHPSHEGDTLLSDPGFLQGLSRMRRLASMALRSLPDQKMIVCDPARPCARGGPPCPDRQMRMRLKQPGSGLAAHVVANAASFPNLLERLSLAILAGRSVLLCVSDTAQQAALGLCRLLRATGALPDGVMHVVPVIEAETLLPHLERGDVVTLCAEPGHTATFHAHPKVLEGSVRLGSCQASYAALLLAPEYDPDAPAWDLFLRAVQALHRNSSFATCVLVPKSLEESATDRLLTMFDEVTISHAELPITRPSCAASTRPGSPQIAVVPYTDTRSALEILRTFPGRRNVTVLSRQHGFLGDFLATLAPCLDQISVVSPEMDTEAPELAEAMPGGSGADENILSLLDFYLEESEITGPATLLTEVSGTWIEGVPVREGEHPFRKPLSRLRVGDHLRSADRIVSAEDVEAFGHLTGDLFYAHMDETAARAHPFFDGRVAHGQFIMALANGLFVDPEPGPVLANLGAKDLRFHAPVYFGTSLYVTLTCCTIGPVGKGGSAEVQWACQVRRSDDDTRVAQFDLLTLVAAQWPLPAAQAV